MSLKSTTTSGSTTTYHWNTIFSSVPSTSLSISTTEVFNYAYEALEIYSASGPTDLPNGQTMMSNINITSVDGSHPALNWTAISDSSEGFGMSIVSSASTNGAVQITYPGYWLNKNLGCTYLKVRIDRKWKPRKIKCHFGFRTIFWNSLP